MAKKLMQGIVIVAAICMMLPGNLYAKQMKGKIQYLTNKFKTFLLVEENTGKTEIFKFAKKTTTLQPNDMVLVTYKSAKNGKGVVSATKVEKLYGEGGISPATFKKLQISNAVILDVRTNKDVKKGKIPKAIHIPLNKLEGQLGTLSKSQKIVVYCNSGPIAAIGYNILKNNGFSRANYLAAKVSVKKGKITIK